MKKKFEIVACVVLWVLVLPLFAYAAYSDFCALRLTACVGDSYLILARNSSATTKFSVDTSGNTAVVGTLAVTGATAFTGAVDINAGTIDGTTIGAASASTGAFTTLAASGATTLASTLALSGAATLTGTVSVIGAVSGSGAYTLVGFEVEVYDNTTTYTVLATQSGAILTNQGDSDGTEFDLPADPTGLVYHFAVVETQSLVIDPNSTDQILGLTNAGGDSITEGTIGDSVTLIGVSTSEWVAYTGIGAWPDTN